MFGKSILKLFDKVMSKDDKNTRLKESYELLNTATYEPASCVGDFALYEIKTPIYYGLGGIKIEYKILPAVSVNRYCNGGVTFKGIEYPSNYKMIGHYNPKGEFLTIEESQNIASEILNK